LRNQGYRIQVFRIDFVRLHGYAIPLLDEDYDFERCDGIEHASGNERRRISELGRIFARQEFLDNEILNYGIYVIGHATPWFTAVGISATW
jgi:hypothetical protein